MKLIRLMTIGVLLISAPTMMLAQDEEPAGPRYINIRIQTVKPDRVAQWESLRKEMSENMQEGGQAFYHVYQRQRGPLATYLIVSPATAIGEPGAAIEEPPAVPVSENWLNAMWGTLDSQSLITLRTYPELATLQTGSVPSHPGANFMHVRIRTAAAGRNADFREWLRDELVPALRAAGAGDVRIGRTVLGGSPQTWGIFSFVEGWPESALELDPSMLARGNAMITTQIDYFYSFREDLSFTAN